MRRVIVLLITFICVFSLNGCDKEEQTKFGGALLEQLKENAGNDLKAEEGWETVDQDEPFGKYKSFEELIEIIESGDLSAYAPTNPTNFEEDEEAEVVIDIGSEEEAEELSYTGGSNTMTFSEDIDLSDAGVEFWDWRSEMSPEDLAEYDAFDPNDPQWQQYEEEIMQDMEELEQYQNTDVSTEDYEQQLQDAMNELENMEIPEEYLQYLPEGFDINSLLQQYQ